MKQPCLDCGAISDGGRCADCAKIREGIRTARRQRLGHYRNGYSTRAAAVRANATRCWLCGGGPRPDDPWQADHVEPLAQGGHPDGALAPAHRSCNILRAKGIAAQQQRRR
jgi:hypothetical protein